MDPFEEFEFKPLTEGLGFHKKNKKATPAPFPLTSKGMEILEEEVSPLAPPLPRDQIKEKYKEMTKQSQDHEYSASSAAVEEILQTLRSKKTAVAEKPTEIAKAPAVPRLKPSVPNISAMFLDSMLVLAGTLLCMIVLLSVTKVDVGAALFGADAGWVYLSTFALFGTVSFIYLVVHRVFLGATPGEWAYDQQIGHPEEVGEFLYSMAVVMRSLLVILTGFFVLPLISIFMGRDITGTLSGTQLFERS